MNKIDLGTFLGYLLLILAIMGGMIIFAEIFSFGNLSFPPAMEIIGITAMAVLVFINMIADMMRG